MTYVAIQNSLFLLSYVIMSKDIFIMLWTSILSWREKEKQL